ncbi:hypothetical protein [Halostagnicola bangensis]
MISLEPIFRLNRERIEPALALLVIFLVGFWAVWTQIPLDTGWTPPVDLFVLPVLLIPGVLALFVLLGSLAYGVRLVSALAMSGELPQSMALVALGIASSVLYGVVSAYTLWWATASVYVIYFGDSGGVLLHPFVVMGLGIVLSVLVLLRVVYRRLFVRKRGLVGANASS